MEGGQWYCFAFTILFLESICLKIPLLSTQNLHSAGGRRGPKLLVLIGILIFLLVRSPCKILDPYDNSFWGKSNPRREREEREKIPQSQI